MELNIKPILCEELDTESTISLQYNDVSINLGCLDESSIEKVMKKLERNKSLPLSKTMDENLDVLDKVSRIWLDDSSSYRKQALQVLPSILNHSKEMVKKNLDLAIQIFSKEYLERIICFELGNKGGELGKEYVDGWVDEGLYSLHLSPRQGILFHNIAGNALIVPVVSILAGILSKKVNIIKISKNDPYFAHALISSIISVDESFKETLNIGYWPSSDTGAYKELFSRLKSQYVIHWGTAESTFAIEDYCNEYEVRKYVAHGPKISFEVIEKPDEYNYREMAKKIIENDVLYWEQSACSSARIIFIQEDRIKGSQFVEELARSFDNAQEKYPFNLQDTIDDSSQQKWLEKLIKAGKAAVTASKDKKWHIVYSQNKPRVRDIPNLFGRLIYVCSIESLDEVVDFLKQAKLGYFLQVMGYNGQDMEFCQKIGEQGVSLITHPGEMNFHMPGTAHDGIHNVRELFDPVLITRQKKIDLMHDTLHKLKKSQVFSDNNQD